MKRLCLVGMAVLGLLTAGIASVASAKTTSGSKPAKKTTKVVTTRVTCKVSLVTQIPSNDTGVAQGATSGAQFGFLGCDKPLHKGVVHDTWTQDTSGDLSGSIQHWFNNGSVYGTFALTPASTGPPQPTTFAAESFSGTITLKGATGAFKGVTGKGTLVCSTPDLAHFSCTEKLLLKQTVSASSTAK